MQLYNNNLILSTLKLFPSILILKERERERGRERGEGEKRDGRLSSEEERGER